MGEKMKRFMREQSNREADEIMAMIDQDPEMADVHAPDELGVALFAQIDEYEKSKTHNLSEEEKELIELGKVYKKRRKARKYVAVAAIAVMAMTFGGVTVMGGPEKVMEVMKRAVMGREHTVVNSDDDRVVQKDNISEEEAYNQIQEEFGFLPVKLDYLPKGVGFSISEINEETQCINLVYQSEDEATIMYVLQPNYKVSSLGNDVEDVFIEEQYFFEKNVEIILKHYQVQETREDRWIAQFEYNNVFYYLQLYNIKEQEVNAERWRVSSAFFVTSCFLP